MEKIDLIPRIKELYSKGENIIQFLKKEGRGNINTVEDILISYDFQAGSYIRFTNENPGYNNSYTQAIANVLNDIGSFKSVLEVGAGEATTLANVATKLKSKPPTLMGFDISWSRIMCGRQYLKEKNVDASLFVGDLFYIPLPDNSVDILYTSHSLEPNGGKEKEALAELYRVAKNYIVLLEPTNEFANDEGKERMKRNGYVQNLKKHIAELNYDLVVCKPFEISGNPLNPTGLYVIKKGEGTSQKTVPYCCPISKKELTEYDDHFFSPESLISYPKIMGIPCLCASYGVLTTKHG
jgi:hypothetical protein